MSRPPALAEVEAQIAELDRRYVTDPDLSTDEYRAERVAIWERAAREYAAGIRRIHRHLKLLRSHFPATTRYQELTHVIDEIVTPELVDQEPSSGGDQR